MTGFTSDQLLFIARQHLDAGRLTEARDLCTRVLAGDRENAAALLLRGLVAERQGAPDTAAEFLKRARAGLPDNPRLLGALGRVLFRLGRCKDAEQTLERALALTPDDLEILRDYSQVLIQFARYADLVAVYRTMLKQSPDDAATQSLLADALYQTGDTPSAAHAAKRALELDPHQAGALLTLGRIEADRDDNPLATTYYRRALEIQPENPAALTEYGNLLLMAGHADEAVAAYSKALKLSPQDRNIEKKIGGVVRNTARQEALAASFRKLLEKDPDNADIHFDLALIYKQLRNSDGAIEEYRRVLELEPDNAPALNNLGSALKDSGELDEAIRLFRKGMEADKTLSGCQESLIYTIHFHPEYGLPEVYREHQQWNARFAEPLKATIQPHENDRSPDRRLKIGYVSPNFSMHPVGRFMLSLCRAHDHNNFEVFCYSNKSATDDEATRQFLKHADVWIETQYMSDEELAARIRREQIDILIDLNMHMGHSRMLMFARKPAPVQITYLAYCSTTGLTTMDYRITDPYLDPPERDDKFYSEKSLRLPRTYWCYEPVVKDVEINALPATSTGHITFASLNNFCKVTPATLALWARLLAAVPNSQLLLHCWPGTVRDRAKDFFIRSGIAGERLRFFDMVSLRHFFKMHHAIDIALDPFPYPGGTTTCDSLWMGVPTVSLVGDAPWTRAGLSIMSNIGLPELATFSEESYLQTAIALATDLPRLAFLRATLRQRMIDSPLMNGPQFARDMENLYRLAWHNWCK